MDGWQRILALGSAMAPRLQSPADTADYHCRTRRPGSQGAGTAPFGTPWRATSTSQSLHGYKQLASWRTSGHFLAKRVDLSTLSQLSRSAASALSEADKVLADRLMVLVEQAQEFLDAHDNERGQAVVAQARSLDPGSSLQHPANVLVQTQAALLALRQGDRIESARLAWSALSMANALEKPHLSAQAHLAVARVSLAIGDVGDALDHLEQGWSHLQSGQDLSLRFWYQTNIGIAISDLDNDDESVDWFKQALETAQTLGEAPLIGLSAANLSAPFVDVAGRAYAKGDLGTAKQAWQAALDATDIALPLIQQKSVKAWTITAVMNRSTALGGLGFESEAFAGLSRAFELAKQMGNLDAMAKVHFNRAQILFRAGHAERALSEVRLAVDEGEAANSLTTLITIYEFASVVAEHASDPVGALSYARRHHGLYVQAATDRAVLRSKLLAVRMATDAARAEAAAERLNRVSLSESYKALEQKAEKLHHEATHDVLTGLFNRREFNRYLDAAHASATSDHRRLYVAMLDVDHFKSINDLHSHLVGDRVLKQIGSLVNVASRDRDFVSRFGGEEFIVVMGDVRPEQAAAVAERLRQTIQDFDWTVLAPGLHVTASLGVYNIARSSDCVSGLAEVDKLLYAAKAQGRNRVVCDGTVA